MRSEEKVSVGGTIEYRIYLHGVEIEHVLEHNLVVNGGRHRLAEMISGQTPAHAVAYLGVGEGSVLAKVTDASLKNQLLIPVLSAKADGNDAIFEWRLETSEGNGMSITEFGLFTKDEKMVTRQVRGKVIGKGADMRIDGTYTLHF